MKLEPASQKATVATMKEGWRTAMGVPSISQALLGQRSRTDWVCENLVPPDLKSRPGSPDGAKGHVPPEVVQKRNKTTTCGRASVGSGPMVCVLAARSPCLAGYGTITSPQKVTQEEETAENGLHRTYMAINAQLKNEFISLNESLRKESRTTR